MTGYREWDHGKDWNGGGHRGYTRGRDEDEYYSEGKRRKYNNGGYEESQWGSHENDKYHNSYSNDNYGHSGNYNNNSNNSNDQSYSHSDRHESGHRDRGGPRKKHVASDPTPHVIFLGLDPDFTEADLQNFLKERGYVIETVTIIRDRTTGQSKGFGFAQFRSTEEARSFVDPNFPYISVPPPASHGASAAAAYKKAEEDGIPHSGKRVKIDYSMSANSSGSGRRGPQFANDGTRDIGNTQSPILLFRGLDSMSGPTAIAQAMKSSSGPNVEGAKGMKRVILIKDKATMASWGYTFVEFVDIQSASAVLAATMSPQLHPNGFRISDRPVAASFAHPYSFQPIADNLYQDESCIPSSLNLGGVEGTFVKYWDDASTVATMDFKVEEPKPETSAPAKEKKDKEKKRAKGENPAAKVAASVLPVSDKPVTLSFNKIGLGNKVSTGPVAPSLASQAVLLLSSTDENEAESEGVSGGPSSGSTEAKDKQAHKPPPMIMSKKVVNNITKWNQVQEELSSGTAQASSGHNDAPVDTAKPPINTAGQKDKSKTPEVEADFEFSDTKAMTCLLCSRQFKTIDQLKRHNKESDLHKKNFKDASLRELARQKVQERKESSLKSVEESSLSLSSTSSAMPKAQYRDRASERRILFNQPEVPVLELKTQSKRSAEGPVPVRSPTPPPPAVAPAKDENNIGNKLLKMMGWTEGSGLGTEGSGRVDPIETAVYAAGVGLGASKGRDISKYTENTGYSQMAKEVARERYEA